MSLEKISTVAEIRKLSAVWRRKSRRVAFVPTQGALHAGQEALIRAAAEQADIVVVSIFINPLQFSPNDLLQRYPRSLEDDLQICEAAGADVVFVPEKEEMYPGGFSTYVTEEKIAKPLEGISRSQHFRGVATVMARFFNLIRPDLVFFGQKAAQRAAMVRKMIADLGWEIELVVIPTVREEDGLAAGVPNRTFTSSQRQEALAVIKSLREAKSMSEKGVSSPDRIVAEVTHILGEHRRVRIIYVSIVDPETMESMREVVPGRSLLVVAVWVDEVRLIDNMVL